MKRGYEPIGSIVQKALKRINLDKRLEESKIFEEWDEIVGKEISQHAVPDKIYKNILFVSVDSPVWMSELNTFFKSKILDSLREKTGLRSIKNIRFRVSDFVKGKN